MDNMVKLNFDGSKLSNGAASFGFVIRNSNGDVLLTGARSLGSSDGILQAEAWGLLEGIRRSIVLNVSRLWIDGDNHAVINSISVT